VVLGISYAVGGPLLGIGLYLLVRGAFPGWWKEWILRPVVRVTAGVARLQGVTAIGLGASLVAIGWSEMVSEHVGGLLVVIALGAYLIGAGIFVYSTWLSRRGLDPSS
jgi:predicted transporter